MASGNAKTVSVIGLVQRWGAGLSAEGSRQTSALNYEVLFAIAAKILAYGRTVAILQLRWFSFHFLMPCFCNAAPHGQKDTDQADPQQNVANSGDTGNG